MLRNLVFFNRLFFVFETIDSDGDRRLDVDEFTGSLKKLGLNLPKKEAEEEFKSIDLNGGGSVLFDEFCTWYMKKKHMALPNTQE